MHKNLKPERFITEFAVVGQFSGVNSDMISQ